MKAYYVKKNRNKVSLVNVVVALLSLLWKLCLGLCQNDLYDYVKHVKVCDVMKEGVRVCRMKYKRNDCYVQGLITCTHTVTLEWMNEDNLSQKRDFGLNTTRELRWSVL